MYSKATKVHQKGRQNDQGTSKKEPCGKVLIFDAKKDGPPRFLGAILGAKSPRDWTSLLPDHTFGPCKMYAFPLVLIGFEQTSRFVEICFRAVDFFFRSRKLMRKKAIFLRRSVTPQTPGNTTIQQDPYGGNLHK